MRYFRAYALDPDGVLCSPIKTHLRFPTPEHTARCWGGHAPPAPDCKCGLYCVTDAGWPRLCLGSAQPRVLAEVEPLGPPSGVDGRCPRFWRSHSVRVGSLRLLELWAPTRQHCNYCWAHPLTPDWTDETIAALAARYGVPVGRLPQRVQR
jgi:hypothetical protein